MRCALSTNGARRVADGPSSRDTFHVGALKAKGPGKRADSWAHALSGPSLKADRFLHGTHDVSRAPAIHALPLRSVRTRAQPVPLRFRRYHSLGVQRASGDKP